MVVNMNMISDGEGSINEALTDTIASVFGESNLVTADVPHTTNRELFALKRGSASSPSIRQRIAAMRAGNTALDRAVDQVDPVFEPVHVGRRPVVLTDDKAPVEVLGMRAIDGIIAEQAGPYRQILRDEGIGGLLREVR